MAVDLHCVDCLKLWEEHGAATAELRDEGYGPRREMIEVRLQAAATAISAHEQDKHSASAT
jgi:hypothetical protein